MRDIRCPYCGEEMERGDVFAPKGVEMLWLPKEKKLPLIITKKNIAKKGGYTLSGLSYLADAQTTAYACKTCKKIVIEFE